MARMMLILRRLVIVGILVMRRRVMMIRMLGMTEILRKACAACDGGKVEDDGDSEVVMLRRHVMPEMVVMLRKMVMLRRVVMLGMIQIKSNSTQLYI